MTIFHISEYEETSKRIAKMAILFYCVREIEENGLNTGFFGNTPQNMRIF